MKLVLLCVVALLMVVQLPSEGEAVCCHGRGFLWGARCADCSRATPYCSYGKPCNIFGCNCKGGCRTGSCQSLYNHAHEMPVTEVPVARVYDVPYDSSPNGKETVIASSEDYEAPMDDVPNGSESETSAMNDYEMPADEVSGVSESEAPASSDYEMPADEVSGASESEAPASSDYEMPADEVSGVSESENPAASSDYEMPATGSDNDGGSEASSADDVIASADENGDGQMDIDEAERFLVKRGLATHRAKRSLRKFDLNNDNFISAEEIEQYEEN